MLPRRIALLLTALYLTTLSLAGCGDSKSAPGKPVADSGSGGSKAKIAIVTNNEGDFWRICEAGAKKAADEQNVDLVFQMPTPGTADRQKEIIDVLLGQKVAGIAISVAPDSKRLCYIGTNNYQAGLAAGRLVKEVMPEGGVIAMFVGSADAANARDRRQGILDELAGVKDAKGPKYGKYALLDTFVDDTVEGICKEKAATAIVQLKNEPNVCLIGLWAYNPGNILSAVKDAGKQGKIKIVGFDEMDNTLQGIKEGAIFGSIVQQPYLFGYESVKLLNELAHGDKSHLPADGLMNVPHRVINKENVEAFHSELKKLTGK
jgi:ribose transport system substrate-binding protein